MTRRVRIPRSHVGVPNCHLPILQSAPGSWGDARDVAVGAAQAGTAGHSHRTHTGVWEEVRPTPAPALPCPGERGHLRARAQGAQQPNSH